MFDGGSMVGQRIAAVVSVALLGVVLTGCSSTSMLNVPQDDHAQLQVWIREPPGSDQARETALQNFEWRSLCKKVEKIYANLLNVSNDA